MKTKEADYKELSHLLSHKILQKLWKNREAHSGRAACLGARAGNKEVKDNPRSSDSLVLLVSPHASSINIFTLSSAFMLQIYHRCFSQSEAATAEKLPLSGFVSQLRHSLCGFGENLWASIVLYKNNLIKGSYFLWIL